MQIHMKNFPGLKRKNGTTFYIIFLALSTYYNVLDTK